MTCAHTSNRLRHFNIRIILPATHQGSVKALSKAKLWDYSGQTPQKRHLRKTFAISETVYVWETVPGIWLAISSPKWNSQKGSRLYNRDKRRKINHCHLSRNITHQCLISREYSWKMALDREPTLTQGNIQGTPFHLLQKGEIFKRYTCESKALRVKIQHHHEKWELCLVCQHSFNLSVQAMHFRETTQSYGNVAYTSVSRNGYLILRWGKPEFPLGNRCTSGPGNS